MADYTAVTLDGERHTVSLDGGAPHSFTPTTRGPFAALLAAVGIGRKPCRTCSYAIRADDGHGRGYIRDDRCSACRTHSRWDYRNGAEVTYHPLRPWHENGNGGCRYHTEQE